MTPAEARFRFVDARVGHLATAGPAGPHIVPITFAVEGDTIASALLRSGVSHRTCRTFSSVARANHHPSS